MAGKGLTLDVPGGATRVLLHTCCAPCSGAIIECLLEHGITPVIFFSNSNIFPEEEYLKRKAECTRFAQAQGLEIVDDDYDHGDWRGCVARGLENEPERGARCLACFEYRLLRAARYAREHGFSVLTTTLASSRWKDLAQVDAAGIRACDTVSSNGGTPVVWWGRNWRKGGLQERRGQIIKEQGFYNQQWCGCEYSLRNTETKDND